MGTEIELSKREQMLVKARQNLAYIQDSPRATQTEAAKAISILVASYPMTPPAHPDVYMQQACTLLAGATSEAVMTLVDPNRGLVGQCTFLPTLAEINKWIKDFEEPILERIHSIRAEIKTLEGEIPMEELTPDERDRRIKVSEQIKSALKRIKLGNPVEDAAKEARMNERFKRQQRSVPELAMEALKNLENSRGGG